MLPTQIGMLGLAQLKSEGKPTPDDAGAEASREPAPVGGVITANSEPNVFVPMTLEEAARRWLSQQWLFAIDYSTVEELANVYRAHGPKVLVYDTVKNTYFLCEKHEREAMLKEDAAKRAKV